MEISGFHGWLGPLVLLVPLPTLNSETGARTLFLRTTQAKGKALDTLGMTGTGGWETT